MCEGARSRGEELFIADLTTGVDELLEGVAVVPLVDVHRSRHGTILEPEAVNSRDARSPRTTSLSFGWVGEPAILAAEVILVGEEKRPQLIRCFGAQGGLPATCAPCSLAFAQCSTRT